jgi:hypothetical protein
MRPTAAKALHAARDDEPGDVLRSATQRRADEEEDHTAEIDVAATPEVGEAAVRRRERRAGEQIGNDDPGVLVRSAAEVRGDLGQRRADNGVVERRHEQREREAGENEAALLARQLHATARTLSSERRRFGRHVDDNRVAGLLRICRGGTALGRFDIAICAAGRILFVIIAVAVAAAADCVGIVRHIALGRLVRDAARGGRFRKRGDAFVETVAHGIRRFHATQRFHCLHSDDVILRLLLVARRRAAQARRAHRFELVW